MEYWTEDDFYPGSPPLEPIYPRAEPSPSPPPVSTRVYHLDEQDDSHASWLSRKIREAEEQYPHLANSAGSCSEKSLQPKDNLPLLHRTRKKDNRRKIRPTQGDWVLIREMDPNRHHSALEVSQQALHSDSSSDDGSRSDDDSNEASAPSSRIPSVDIPILHSIIAVAGSTSQSTEVIGDIAAEVSLHDASSGSTSRGLSRKRPAPRSSEARSGSLFSKRRRHSTDEACSSPAVRSPAPGDVMVIDSGPVQASSSRPTVGTEATLPSSSPDAQSAQNGTGRYLVSSGDSSEPLPCTYCHLSFVTRGQLTEVCHNTYISMIN